ncbi:expressed unknown protein [Seminavis robusta]|uniref:NAD(P)-binding domain-containing protein n=1 Tax=Seminavis robusta TaxID=568900 RepID=A0A9N8EHS6_9STRA|nr:expressed unknown protein [Seminavis robusta]|eukprot:Sro1188_g250540.1 n/a (272) ;mRNA; r:2531-3346
MTPLVHGLSNSGKRVIVAGATGSVGQLLVRVLLSDPRVQQVTAIVRQQPVADDRAKTIWSATNSTLEDKLSQLVVDFDDLGRDKDIAASKQRELIGSAFENHDAFLTAIGIYSQATLSEDEMDQVESHSVVLGNIAAEAGVARGAYLSGGGVKQPTLEGRASSMFARSKGRTEESLANLFPSSHVSCRPAAILDRPGPPAYGFLDGYLLKTPLFAWLRNTSMAISAVDIAKGMVQGAAFDKQELVNGNVIWENNDIKEAAKRYDDLLRNEM